jgi:hypothetical protein
MVAGRGQGTRMNSNHPVAPSQSSGWARLSGPLQRPSLPWAFPPKATGYMATISTATGWRLSTF